MTTEHAILNAIGALKRLSGRQITYRRASMSVLLTAVPTDRRVISDHDGQGIVESVTTDWIVLADDLVLDSIAITPKSGDSIEFQVGEVTTIYEVMPVARRALAEPAYHCVSPGVAAWRVHTRLVQE